MESPLSANDLKFLSGGGEMGALIRGKNWSETALGEPQCWPQSLRITLSILLNSSFPMFLWWGPELICFYNDAYRPSLGQNGKHPQILGMKGDEAWPEIWTTLKPWIDEVLHTGKSLWNEDLLVPIYRNGKIEDVYWTFSYSPVPDESGKPVGVFVTCVETTEKVKNLKKIAESEQALKESESRFRTMAEATDVLIAVGDETGNATYFNQAWVNLTGRPMEELQRFGWVDLVHPEDKERYVDIYLSAFEKRAPFTGLFRVLNKNGEYRSLLAKGPPLFRPDGSFAGYISSCTDITEQFDALTRIEENEQDLHNLVMQAPIGICVLDASTLVSEIVNERFVEIAGKPYEAIAGKHYWDTFAEAKAYYEPAMKEVVETGITFNADEVKLMLVRHGKEEIIYVTFVYAPLKDKDDRVKKVAVWVLENTKQVTARQKIEEAEQKTMLALNSAELGVYEIIYDTDEMFTDDRFKEIWGVKKSASRPEYVASIHPGDLAQRAEAHKQSITTGQLDYKTRVLWNDGSVHWARVTGTVIYNKDSTPFKLIGIVQDITASVIAQKKIEESERDLRNIIKQAPVAMCIFRGPEYNIEIANNKMFELWGRTAAETVGKPVFEALPEVSGHGFEEMLLGVFTSGKRFLGDEQPVPLMRDGKLATVYVNFVYEAMKKGDGTVSGILAVAVDVTPQVVARRQIEEVVAERTKELKELNESLKKSEERYHLMVEEVQDYAIIYLNAKGIIENWNLGAEKIKGYKAEEIIGKSFSTFYTEEDRKTDLPKTLLDRAQKTGRAGQEGWRVRKDGSLFWANVVITALHDEAGKLIGFSKVTHDLSERKKADDKLRLNAAELELKNTELERMNKELESFAYISSHDLQEPLRKIQTFTSQLLEKEAKNLSENGVFKFQRMHSAAQRMQKLIEDLLAYSRTSTLQRKFELTNLQGIIENVKEDLKEELQLKHAVIEAKANCGVKVIPFQFRQLLYNLISNSLKFSKKDETPRIKINCEVNSGANLKHPKLTPDGQYAYITISDNGIGFEPQFNEKIFEVFQRLHLQEEYTGTGIGLAIVKKIVENHHGIITAEGELNKGATFHIFLPGS